MFWPPLKGVFLVIFRIWRGTRSSLEHKIVVAGSVSPKNT